MEIKVKRSDLLRELTTIQGIVERKTTMPILSNVLFEAHKKHLITTATDLEVGISTSAPAEVLRPGSVTVHARGLFDIVKELPDELVHINVKENHWLTIICGRAEFQIVGLAPDEFPQLPKKKEGISTTLECKTIVGMIEKCSFAMSTDETRYNLNGIYLEPQQEGKQPELRMVATDGHRLSIVDRPGSGAWKITAGIIVPRKGVMELKRLIEDKEGTFELWSDGKHLIAYADQVTLVIRLIDGQFPPYRQVVPKEAKRVISVSRDHLYRALKRVSAMASDRTRGVKFAISPKNIEISTNNPDFGQAREELSATYQGSSFEIGFNGRYFLEAVSILDDEQIAIQLGDETSPCLFKSELDRGFTHVIMPMRL